MRRITRILPQILVGIVTLMSHAPAMAQRDLNEAAGAASLIVVGRLDQYIAEPESIDRLVQDQARASGALMGNPAAVVMGTIQPRGTYVFHVTSTIKGQSPQPLIVRLPRVSALGLGITGPRHSIPLKASYLLLLSGDATSGFSPATQAPILISPSVELPKQPAEDLSSARSAVLRLLIESMANPEMRATSAYVIRNTVDELVLQTLRAYADDPDDTMRRFALECMAVNQDVTAIPKIAAWKYSSTNSSGNPVTTSLSKYKTIEAIPYLNQLLLDTNSQYMPQNAASALRQLPLDKSSIPFFIKALRQPLQAPYHAYNALHTLVPSLGPPMNVPQFGQNREMEIKKLEDWWAAEQAKNPQAPN